MYFVAALIPMIVGAVYYNPKVLGNAWMRSAGLSMEDLEGANMAKIFGFAYLLSVFFAFGMTSLVLHQGGIFSTMAPEVMESGSATQQQFNALMEQYGDRYRSFGHGALHGFFSSIVLVLPVIGVVALFERRNWKYIMIHWGYWAIVMVLVGGLLCQTLVWAELS
jgi:NADH:ubiquinone oxidoreductase subunit K